MQDIKQAYIDDGLISHISTIILNSLKVIHNHTYYSFKKLFGSSFDFLDKQGRITLLSQEKRYGGFRKNILGVHSKHDYRNNVSFNLKDMASIAQINGYERILRKLDTSIEEILHYIFY